MLTPEAITHLADLPEHEAAVAILSASCGPIADAGIEPFRPVVAHVAYLVHRAYRISRRPGGMLSGRPGYEAIESLRHRVHSAAETAGSLTEFGRQLFDRLNSDISALRPAELLWWRQVWSSFSDEPTWWWLSSDDGLVELLSAFSLLNDCLYALRNATNTKE